MALHPDVRAREAKWQLAWEQHKLFEAQPKKGQPKFFCTFPYPYVNGLPHVGHLFSIMRTEAFARYHRHLGHNVLFPQGFHATGSPIVAAANRVKEGEEKQIKILKDFGVAEQEIERFANPEHWIEYFVPRYREDLTRVGLSIDWRRSFTTTSLNPSYDAFIRWQFHKLKERGYVVQGSHPVVWCPKDHAPIGDHDRLAGEGETPQEFLLVKHKLDDGRYIVSATLRPDTILGVTNLYVNPQTEYVQATVDGEQWILGKAAAQRLEQQEHDVKITGNVHGKDLIGKNVLEFAGHKVPILPATFLDPAFGTGLVHSVPSDSADDLIALRDLQIDEAMMKKFNLDPAMVRAIEPIAVLDTPGISGIAAQHFIDEYKVKHQNERAKLDEIKEKLYKLSFYESTFNSKYEKFGLTGIQVQKGKEQMQKIIIEQGWATPYYQLTGKVVCRCQSEAIVKLVSNQWFIAYDNEEWKAQVREALKDLQLYPPKARTQFEYVIEWLKQWACTREYGLGTRLPWDEQWLIESLSDSTIYMAYYTIAHLVRDVPVEKLDSAFFDWVLLGKGTTPHVPHVEQMREEFLYWYPMDFRNSGKDLIQNHLTFMLFNHCAIFEKQHWPKGIGVNGWVTVNGQKMSKSLGNVIPVRNLADEFGADACRITILNGGEGMDDPNWDSNFAKGVLGRLETLIAQAHTLRTFANAGGDAWMDAWLCARTSDIIRQATQAMDATNFRTAIQLALFEYAQVLRWYRERAGERVNAKLLRKALEEQIIMLAPFVPHACEQAWEALGNTGFASVAPWPVADHSTDNALIVVQESMIEELAEQIKKGIAQKTPSHVHISLAHAWKREAYKAFDACCKATRNPKEILASLQQTPLKTHGEELIRLVQFLVKSRVPGTVLSEEQERTALDAAKGFLEKIAGTHVTVLGAGEGTGKRKDQGLPAKPAVEIV